MHTLKQRAQDVLDRAQFTKDTYLEGIAKELVEIADVADRRTAQVEEIAKLLSRPHAQVGPERVVGAVEGVLSNLRHSSY